MKIYQEIKQILQRREDVKLHIFGSIPFIL